MSFGCHFGQTFCGPPVTSITGLAEFEDCSQAHRPAIAIPPCAVRYQVAFEQASLAAHRLAISPAIIAAAASACCCSNFGNTPIFF